MEANNNIMLRKFFKTKQNSILKKFLKKCKEIPQS